MKLTYQELYGRNSQNEFLCFPAVNLEYLDDEKDLIPNLKAEYIDADDECDLNIAYLTLNYGLFDCLSAETISKLEVMLRFIQNTYDKNFINKYVWKSILVTTNINLGTIHKIVNTNFSKVQQKRKLIHQDYTKNANERKIYSFYNSKNVVNEDDIAELQEDLYFTIQNSILTNEIDETEVVKNIKLKEKYKLFVPYKSDLPVIDIMKRGYNGGIFNIDYEIEFKNELELLYTFLDCIFSSEYNYCIKKCKYCEKFFIALKSDTDYCQREYEFKGEMIACSNIVATLQKQYPYRTFQKEDSAFRKSLKSKSYVSDSYIDDYVVERDKVIKACLKSRNLSELQNFVSKYKEDNPIY